MAVVSLQVSLVADAGGGALNPAIVDFDWDAETEAVAFEQAAAQAAAYLVLCAGLGGVSQKIVGMKMGLAGADFVPIPFPTATYDPLATANPDLAGPNAYNVPFGSSTDHSLPRGTSFCVSEMTAGPGRFGRGRHFIPFIGERVNTILGLVDATYSTGVLTAWRNYIAGEATGDGTVELPACVRSSGPATKYAILDVSAAPSFSLLQSRKR